MPAPYLPDIEILNAEGAVSDWGKAIVKLGGDEELMLEGLRDYIYYIKGKVDISTEVKKYFKENGYEFDSDDDDYDW